MFLVKALAIFGMTMNTLCFLTHLIFVIKIVNNTDGKDCWVDRFFYNSNIKKTFRAYYLAHFLLLLLAVIWLIESTVMLLYQIR